MDTYTLHVYLWIKAVTSLVGIYSNVGLAVWGNGSLVHDSIKRTCVKIILGTWDI